MNIELTKIEDIAERIADAYRKTLADKGIDATGSLGQSAKTAVTINGNRLIVSLNLDDYWKYVEYGRRAGKMPPIDAIEGWVKIKPVVPNAVNGKIPSSRQLAFLIARKIGREGIPAKRPLEATLYSDVTEQVIQDIKNEIIRQLNNYLLGQTQ